MSQLEPVTLSYDGKDYVVDKEDGIWGLIEAIEDVITFFELALHSSQTSSRRLRSFEPMPLH